MKSGEWRDIEKWHDDGVVSELVNLFSPLFIFFFGLAVR